MKCIVQRVSGAEITINGSFSGKIGKGMVVLCGFTEGDDLNTVSYCVDKIASLRIFEDENGKMNLSVLDVKGQILAVSQFTLCGDVRHGNRPSFITAMAPDMAKEGYSAFCAALRTHGAEVKEGIFGADMQINQLNDGPVTIWYDI